MTNKLFLGGLPTDIDVKKLTDAFAALSPGQEITHEDVERVTGLDREGTRYRTVVSAWRRKLLREHNVDIGAVAGTGFRVLTPEERVSAGVQGARSGVKKVLRSVRRAASANTDDPVLMAKQDTLRRLGLAVSGEYTSAAKRLEPPKPAEQLPQRKVAA